MKKFLVLYRSTVPAKEQMMGMTPEQRQSSMAEWMAWFQRAAAAVVEMGTPTGDSTVINGAAASGFIGGYTIIQAESPDAAKRVFDGHPHLGAPGSSIELLELLPMPGQ